VVRQTVSGYLPCDEAAPSGGLEPPALRLTGARSTFELQGNRQYRVRELNPFLQAENLASWPVDERGIPSAGGRRRQATIGAEEAGLSLLPIAGAPPGLVSGDTGIRTRTFLFLRQTTPASWSMSPLAVLSPGLEPGLLAESVSQTDGSTKIPP
jgi:hypothetical protein